ncbi:methionine-R-sulfoxide reductase [candidate division TM7 genomosp. GTL1]|nr:methionine-R-sulfoxide reductase [candidate division TM7 genomosp. GTL1]
MIQKSDEQWKESLTKEEYEVLREKKTEVPYTGKFVNFTEKGTYTCTACGNKLFDSSTKFDAHCGWPSFFDALPGAVEFHKDTSQFMNRVEVTCAHCGSHLGHIFEGEGFGTPTDKRFCINSLSLHFKK